MASQPKRYHAIMVSSTFTDLEEHRREVIGAVMSFGFMANVMEHSGAQAEADVIDTSLQMVGDSAAYIAVIGHKYGQMPVDADRNPNGVSITELEGLMDSRCVYTQEHMPYYFEKATRTLTRIRARIAALPH